MTGVSPEDFGNYLQKEGLPEERLDAQNWRFTVPASVHGPREADFLVNVVHQGQGVWSISTLLFRIPSEDTPECCKLLRTVLNTRAACISSAAIFLEHDMLFVATDSSAQSPAQIIRALKDVADLAGLILMDGMLSASSSGLKFLQTTDPDSV